MYAILRN